MLVVGANIYERPTATREVYKQASSRLALSLVAYPPVHLLQVDDGPNLLKVKQMSHWVVLMRKKTEYWDAQTSTSQRAAQSTGCHSCKATDLM